MAELVSVVATIRNDRGALPAFLDALFQQSRSPDELVFVDGGSKDGTYEWLLAAAQSRSTMHVSQVPGSNISAGRNAAIRAAKGAVIAVTDAGTVAEPDWLARLIAPFECDHDVAVVSGWFRPGGRTWFERALSIIITPHIREIGAETFLPSSRSVAFRREWWQRANGYPEWLTHCEDLVFDLELRRQGARFVFRPDAVVLWASRSSLAGFFRQYFLYARGDCHAGLFARRHVVRYSAYAVGTALVLASERKLAQVGLGAGVVAYLGKYERRVWRHLGWSRDLPGTAALVPLVVVTGDVAKMLGYPAGLLRRRRRMPRR